MDFFRSLYLSQRLLLGLMGAVAVLVLGYVWPLAFGVGRWLVLGLGLLMVADLLLLYRFRTGITAQRTVPERLSNGDDNVIELSLENRYPYQVAAHLVDELPIQFQVRNFGITVPLAVGAKKQVSYTVRPVERGVYAFGAFNVFVQTPIGLLQRRYRFNVAQEVPVYPSYLQMRAYELYAISNRLTEAGVKKIRKIGRASEFDQIRTYVAGDEYRTINWRATARTGTLMVNQYQEEKAQNVYSLIDKGRTMQMPFEGMTLLDYAINASLVISNIALHKDDKPGLLTFSNTIDTLVPAERRNIQMRRILEALYHQKTDFLESDYARLYATVQQKIHQRSLLLLYTNFETRSSLKRQLPYLRALGRHHVVVVIFFENNELQTLLTKPAQDVEAIYIQTMAEKFAFEKREIVRELNRYGLYAVLTAPENLTVETINTYLALKARGVI